MRSKLTKEYLLPTRIVAASESVKNAEALLVNRENQVFFNGPATMDCKGTGYVILDFGKELHGGIRALTSCYDAGCVSPKIRLRFGESVEETCAELGQKNAKNEHSARDFEVVLPAFCDQEYGQTGFRFLRIDFLQEEAQYRFVNIYAAFTHRDLPYRGSFECDDALVNSIFDTARYTVFLNMQNRLWDGIKRDRLVWMGDMFPEALAITDIFGSDECLEESMQDSVDKTPMPHWFSGIPTYSVWFIKILCEYHKKTGRTAFVKKQLPYVRDVLHLLDGCISADGEIDYSRSSSDDDFFDWPTKGTKDARAGNRYLYIIALEELKTLYARLGEAVDPLCDSLLCRLRKKKESGVSAKQVVAFGYLSGELDRAEAAEKLTKDGARGFSTFMSYFILRAIAESADGGEAVRLMKAYYGGMLERGATSFWEDFDVDWLENSGRIDEFTPPDKLDLHGDFGKFCYKGFRHSLCHGWACGPVPFLMEKVLGIEVLEDGCKKLKISPDLGDLKWCKGSFPTPYGDVEIFCENKDGRCAVSVQAPKEVTIIR